MIIVIDGPDGSGKSTQFGLLTERLDKENIPYFKMKFPQYGNKSCGAVEEYLNGKYGTADEVGPKIASIFYAVDRYDASFEIRKQLSEGKVVLLDRYVTANMAHQGGKITDPAQRDEYLEWVKELEYNLFGIPKPDINIFLDCPAEFRAKMIEQRDDKEYIDNKRKDIHESNLEHLKAAEELYLHLAKILPNTHGIPCAMNGELMPPEQIHESIWEVIKKELA